MRYFINLFGESLRYWTCDISQETYNFMRKIKDENQCTWEYLFFDFDFLNSFGFNHWSELSEHPQNQGFLIGETNRIEVKENTKKILKITTQDLVNQKTLFPIYQVSFSNQSLPQLSFKRFVLIQFETGQFAKYSFFSDSFDINKLDFQVQQLDFGTFNQLLMAINYNNKRLELIQEDTVIIKMSVIEM